MRILFAEDDRSLSKAVTTLLSRNGYSVDAVYDGGSAWDYAQGGEYDCVILDVMMPKLDGIAVVQKIRDAGLNTPVLLLTAKNEVLDKITGLDAGADDYLAKPYESGELLARIRALLRRTPDYSPDALTFSDITLDRSTFSLSCGDASVRLGNRAFQVMELLIRSPHHVIPANQIMERIWGWDSESEINVVWVNISFLRKKLAEIHSTVSIQATRGIGYSLEDK